MYIYIYIYIYSLVYLAPYLASAALMRRRLGKVDPGSLKFMLDACLNFKDPGQAWAKPAAALNPKPSGYHRMCSQSASQLCVAARVCVASQPISLKLSQSASQSVSQSVRSLFHFPDTPAAPKLESHA